MCVCVRVLKLEFGVFAWCVRVCVCVGECGVSLFFVNTVMDGVSGMQLQQHSA